MNPSTVANPFIHINGNSGYSRHGDTVSLFADAIDNANSIEASSDKLALQLWACQSPYYGGDLTGWKLAEYQLGPLQANVHLAPVKSDVPASFPEGGDYAIALVIAEWDGQGFNRVHDFHNYPNRDVFLHPRLEGSVGYHCVDEGRVVVDVGRIYNPRDPDNSSGTLALELWALPEPYAGGVFEGQALACTTLGSLAGGESWQDCVYDLEMTLPAAGSYTLTLMLREWGGNGYVTRDHTNFAYPVTFPIDTQGLDTSEIREIDTAPAQVTSSGQSTGQESETKMGEDAAGTVILAEPSQLSDAQQTSEMMKAAMPQAQAVPSEQSAGRASGNYAVEGAADAEPQAGLPQAEVEKQPSLAQQDEKTPLRGYLEALKSFGQRLYEVFKQYDKAHLRGPVDAAKDFGKQLSEFFQKLKK